MLNLLWAAHSYPTVSAYEAINGPFDFNKTPLAPPGIKVVIHEKPSQQKTWDPHGVLGWYCIWDRRKNITAATGAL
jgi:hypothetical protein